MSGEPQATHPVEALLPSPSHPAWLGSILARLRTHDSARDEESLHHLSVGARSTLEQVDTRSEQAPNDAKFKDHGIDSTIPADTATEMKPAADSAAPEQLAEVGADDETPTSSKPVEVERTRKREQEIREVLSVIRHNTPCLLLCREKPGTKLSEVFPLAVGNRESEDRVFPSTVEDKSIEQIEIWRGVQEKWYSMTGPWKKWLLPWYGVKSIKQVKVCVLGTSLARQGTLSARLSTVDIEDEMSDLEREMAIYEKKFLKDLSKLDPSYEYCEYDELADRYSHVYHCAANDEYSGECPVAEQHERSKKWRELRRLRLMPDAFHNPELAGVNDLIPSSFYFTKGRIENLYTIRHLPSVADLDFCGFKLEEGILIHPLQSWPGAALITAFLAILMGTRGMYGDWATAWTAVGSIAAIMAVMIAWTRVAVQ